MLNEKVPSESAKINNAIITSMLVDLPTNKDVFNESKSLNLLTEKGEIQQIKISYPKNGLYGLL